MKRGSRYRPAWEAAHHWVGRAAAGLAIANVFIGLSLYQKWNGSARVGWITYSVVLGAIAAVGLSKVRRACAGFRSRARYLGFRSRTTCLGFRSHTRVILPITFLIDLGGKIAWDGEQ